MDVQLEVVAGIGDSGEYIQENNIAIITMDDGYENADYEPYEGQAKWFVDKLEQLWVKFYILTGDQAKPIQCIVWPAELVTCVEYEPVEARS